MTCFSIQKSLFLALILCLAILPAGSVMAESDNPVELEEFDIPRNSVAVDSPIVIELYTSSDCSACIFADRVIYDATQDKQVIALSCHVKDPTSMSRDGKQEDVTEKIDGPLDPCVFRHWALGGGHRAGEITLAMPAFFFNGQGSISGNKLRFFDSALRRHHYMPPNNIQEAMMRWKDRNTISIHLPKGSPKLGRVNASVWLVRYKDMAVERMDKGVNKGRVLRFSNVIQDITHIAKWHGAARVIDVDVTPPQGGKERGGYAILAAERLGSPYLVAGKLKDYPLASDIEEETEKRARAKESADSRPTVLPSDNQPVNTPPRRR